MLPKLHKNLMFILPFANEIANALTISDLDEFSRLYKPCDKSLTLQVESNIIDAIALFGIIWNVSYMGSKHGTKMGVIYGIIILLLSFIIPNTFMELVINNLPHSDNKYVKLFGSLSFIIVLLLIEVWVSKRLKGRVWKYARYSKT